ncbi:hypothetical protein H696_03601 [Fonticula alba]|uniref:Uncharacterized protein n=1 Tax=Fonticula alba TaxID=691883 RepID=A0A058Z9E9_FONAL|nr:hypothetical protein H696_03601 [Fonticula alba]KCV70142.1 hypothetical protein H696_03601 [Fonticula alba]|eukprot:XP_009495748.1 hypothetical protein H696_03601 [Fonticula alba]
MLTHLRLRAGCVGRLPATSPAFVRLFASAPAGTPVPGATPGPKSPDQVSAAGTADSAPAVTAAAVDETTASSASSAIAGTSTKGSDTAADRPQEILPHLHEDLTPEQRQALVDQAIGQLGPTQRRWFDRLSYFVKLWIPSKPTPPPVSTEPIPEFPLTAAARERRRQAIAAGEEAPQSNVAAVTQWLKENNTKIMPRAVEGNRMRMYELRRQNKNMMRVITGGAKDSALATGDVIPLAQAITLADPMVIPLPVPPGTRSLSARVTEALAALPEDATPEAVDQAAEAARKAAGAEVARAWDGKTPDAVPLSQHLLRKHRFSVVMVSTCNNALEHLELYYRVLKMMFAPQLGTTIGLVNIQYLERSVYRMILGSIMKNLLMQPGVFDDHSDVVLRIGPSAEIRRPNGFEDIYSGHLAIVDQQGRVRWKASGSPEESELEAFVEALGKLLAEPVTDGPGAATHTAPTGHHRGGHGKRGKK